MDQIKVNVVLDSISPHGKRITTFETEMPMHAWVHLLTHRQLSRNLQSSRALPIKTLLKRATYTPEYWGRNKRGMSPNEELDSLQIGFAKWTWEAGRFAAKTLAYVFDFLGLHKETANRILTPFIMVKGLVTATEWDNFIKLRTAPDAQYDIRQVALLIEKELKVSQPVMRSVHAPLLDDAELYYLQRLINEGKEHATVRYYLTASAGRCARVSYLNHDGSRNIDEDNALGKKLWESRHLSPFEHVAISMDDVFDGSGNFFGWEQYRERGPYGKR
ncbi:FAD-dependent thymidylate synthase [Acinetobacter sp.]|uniref:FAD-dependent thymidylate synthase n=1 Tax=Acinetobacter sp. TaxID=472 RepID=UPI003CFD5993